MNSSLNSETSITSINEAYNRIRPYINKTPVLTSNTLNEIASENRNKTKIFFKCENFQKIGAFKARGAINAILKLSEIEARKGVVTHSSGNHAQAIAYAAKLRNIIAHIVMPKNAPIVKINAVKGYGAKVYFCEPNLEARETACEKIISETGATLIQFQ